METATLHHPLTCTGWLDSSGLESGKVMGKENHLISSVLTGTYCARLQIRHTHTHTHTHTLRMMSDKYEDCDEDF